MKKITIISLILLFQFLLVQSFCDAKSFSQSFKITVYIPPHVVTNEKFSSKIRQSQNDLQAETFIEDIIRDNQRIRLQTTVLR